MHYDRQKTLDDYIRSNRLRPSRQRHIILTAFLEYEHGVSAVDLFMALKSRNHTTSISQATVFRTLKLFAAAGIAKISEMSGKSIQFVKQ